MRLDYPSAYPLTYRSTPMAKADPHRLKLSQLRALVAIADTGSFSEAALQMDLSQSAVSHAIATLEDELG